MFTKILIANRGEIACRIMRTAKQWGIHCIAVYTPADQNALHVQLADEAYCLGEGSSYLDQPRLLAIARACQAEAIHPGYGFLSENADFAQACEQHQLIFIGAPSQAIRRMGSKMAAKQLMASAHVPLLPGYHGEDQSPQRLVQEAEKIGYPVLIKASAGGGGKGMRMVEDGADFLDHLASCQREAQKAFGDSRVLLEKYLRAPRHIELQIFADQQGHCVHLFERDCSIQRRHQKVVEEAPAAHLSAAVRQRMGQAAIATAQSVQYVGAGTIEFLYENDAFYFMEMNTRLQVEHPVTEMITGIDLVEWQLRIAKGEALPLTQEQIPLSGHAIEVRLYAEEPEHDFLPSSGLIQAMHLPALSESVRLETGIQVGDRIGIDYDPMLAKLVCWADNRFQACQTMQQALNQCMIAGLKTNLNFLSRLLALPAYRAGAVSTDFIPQHHKALCQEIPLPTEAWLFLCAQRLHSYSLQHPDPWQHLTHWQNALKPVEQWHFRHQQQVVVCQLTWQKTHWHVVIDGQPPYHLHRWHQEGDQWQIHYSQPDQAASSQKALLLPYAKQWQLLYQHQRYTLEMLPRFPERTHASEADHRLLAPMPGRVIAHLATVGQSIEANQALLIMEAMKMEHTIKAPHAGTLHAYLNQVGDIVNEGDLLVELA